MTLKIASQSTDNANSFRTHTQLLVTYKFGPFTAKQSFLDRKRSNNITTVPCCPLFHFRSLLENFYPKPKNKLLGR